MPFCAPWRKPQAESSTLSEIYKGRHHRRGVVAVKIANISRDEESVCRELKFLQQFGGHKNIASYYGAYYRAPLTECSSELLEVRNDLLYRVHSSQSPLEVIECMTLNNFYILQIVLEYCGGGSLNNLISKTNGQSLKETWMAMSGLHHIHKNRAVHRDIKSLNIMLTETAEVKISE
ncbi:serine/threonine-protein kinase mig-15-like [Xenopus laevis]|uniref:Serine/threonine-protein kinase mig-15-like n=1 Tax=Xenopus laevis TaxID=8355 RepID=A0A8J1MHW0_XENLA|nr:serine/threonine-protein kinase mig-15-like [Xenopus laevis]